MGIIFISTVTLLLVGHFKLDWFTDTDGKYSLDIKIKRSMYQANYFREEKIINAEFAFSNDSQYNRKFYIMSDFVVIMANVKKLERNQFLYTAYLIILDSKLKSEDTEYQLCSFNINDEAIIKAFETDPNGNKYTMAIFQFYENGTVFEIKLPNNTGKFIADSIAELIQNLIPKFSRNKIEDLNNGIYVQTKKYKRNKSGRTIVESQINRTHEKFKGSRYSRKVETDIEDEQIRNITVESNASFKTDIEDDGNESDQDDIGVKNFSYSSHSEINATRTAEEKELFGLLEKIGKKFNFISIEKLIENVVNEKKNKKRFPKKQKMKKK